MTQNNCKKRHRVPPTRPCSTSSIADTFPESSQKLRRASSATAITTAVRTITVASSDSSFNDPTTADVILRLYHEFIHLASPPSSSAAGDGGKTEEEVQIYLHSRILRRAKYFSALLSERWQTPNAGGYVRITHAVSAGSHSTILTYIMVLKLLYTDDFEAVINTVSRALDVLLVALELLFDDCVKACIRFIEAVPWTEEEEGRILSVIPLLSIEESTELLARVSPAKEDSCEEMLEGLVTAAIHTHSNMAYVKAFVAKLLRDFSSKEPARKVLETAFETSLKVVKGCVEEYSSPDFRVDHNETEAIQRLNLHTALTHSKHLLWLVERMIELKVADSAVKEWSEQTQFTADLQWVFRDDAWRVIVPGLPGVLLRCTCKIASAVATGSILAVTQVRKRLVKVWLPVLIAFKDNASPMMASHKSLNLELEETFLKIISTLPMSDAQELLKQCLSFSTRNVEDSHHLVTAFNTFFRRAANPPYLDNLGK